MIATDDPGCSKHGTAFKRDYYNGLVRYDSDLGDYAVTLAGAPDQHFAITFGSQAFVSFEELLDTMFHEEHHHLTGSADEGLMDSYAADCTVLAMKGLGDSNDPVEF